MKTLLTFITLLLMNQYSGLAQYENGKCESGNCENGYGVYKFDNGSIYEGNWKNNKFNGEGKYIFLSGNYYEGQFVDGIKHGKGKYSLVEGITFEGIFVHDSINGEGTITYKDGTKFIGNIINFKMQGKGKIIFPDGIAFSGNFVNDTISGDGKVNFKNGSVYEGNLKGFMMEGVGKYIDSSGYIYTGEFKKNRFEGNGERKEVDGLKYVGEFQNNIRHGMGTLIFTNGSKVSARWIMDSITNENLTVEIKNNKQIPLIPYANGLYRIPVKINNSVELLLLFETGVAETMIDEKIIQDLLKNKIIDEKNYLRTNEFKMSDGFTHKKHIYNINTLMIGKFPINNAEIATLEDDKVEPVLGQNALRMLGKIQIDYKNHILSIVK
ncbi:MAG: hypothetical protein V1779_07370 [bacterium]